MAYEKTIWETRAGSNLNRFGKAQETARSVILHNEPDEVTRPGTPFSIQNMNKIEQGIFAAHEMAAAETQARILGDEDTIFQAREMAEDIFLTLTSNADMVKGAGRDLMKVILEHGFEEMTTPALIKEAVLETVAKLALRNNEGVKSYQGLMLGDHLDGIDLSGIAAPNGGTAPAAWNNTYKNNRIVIAGLNFYKGGGIPLPSNTKNHITFTFSNCIARGRINATSTNAGGYAASEIRKWLEGEAGDGSGPFALGLKAAIGNYLYTIRKHEGNKNAPDWHSYTVFLPSEIEMCGHTVRGSDTLPDGTRSIMPPIQLPIYQKSMEYLIKSRNGSVLPWWLSTAYAANAADGCLISNDGSAGNNLASTVYGISPVFCIAAQQ